MSLSRHFACLAPFLLWGSCAPFMPAAAAVRQEAAPLFPLTTPFLFTYGTWDKKAAIHDNRVRLDADGITPRGGAGVNLSAPLDLRLLAESSPVLRVRVARRSTLTVLKLMLVDTEGRSGTWFFTLPPVTSDAPDSGWVDVIPQEGASFAAPNAVGTDAGKSGNPNLARIFQWQLMGDWGGDGAVAVRVEGILAAAPTNPVVRQARQALLARRAEAKAASERERAAARAAEKPPTIASPRITAVYAAAPTLLALEIPVGTITPNRLLPYVAQAGDTVKTEGNGTLLSRGGVPVGTLIGPQHDFLTTFEGFSQSGGALPDLEADDPANYTVRSPDDPTYRGRASGITPLSVSRKTKPRDWQQPKQSGLSLVQRVYLRLPTPLLPGHTYTITTTHLGLQTPPVVFRFDPERVWSESVHVNQIGFRPDDPVKGAFLSLWAGSGGGESFPAPVRFHLIDATGKPVVRGQGGAAWTAATPEKMGTTRNFNGTDVTPLDFSALRTPGQYRVVVDGVGCSYPFRIAPDVWTKAYQLQMQGFYNQRSGIPLKPPLASFVRPAADFRLPTSAPITYSSYSNLDNGDGQKDLAKGDTGKPAPNAWGGWHDAGDWNPRRVTHLRTTAFWQLELLDLFPAYFRSQPRRLNPALPDALSESLWELSLFRRLQNSDGGVSFGIETNGDPLDGEVSWHQSMPAYVYAPDAQSSYVYAAVAARAAHVLAAYDPAQSAAYRQSALRAMAWAEADRTRRQAGGTWAKLPPDVTEDRTLAAACLFALTGDSRWNTVFREDTPLKQTPHPPFYGSLMRRDAAFVYARIPAGKGDPTLREAARRALLADADGALAYQATNAWGIASDDPGKPQFLGFYSTPHGAVCLLRAFTLTHETRYLGGAVRACGFPGGANPSNLVYTSGVGANPIRHPLHLDSRLSGQPAPVGLTVYGNVDLAKWGDQTWITWPLTYFIGAVSRPSPLQWPTTEAYFDVFFMPALNEFTMDQTMGPNAYVWGYLAARPPL